MNEPINPPTQEEVIPKKRHALNFFILFRIIDRLQNIYKDSSSSINEETQKLLP